MLQSDAPKTQVSVTQTSLQNPAEDDAPRRGNRDCVQANQPVRQRKSLHSGAVSQADVFALHANNQFTTWRITNLLLDIMSLIGKSGLGATSSSKPTLGADGTRRALNRRAPVRKAAAQDTAAHRNADQPATRTPVRVAVVAH